MDNGDKFIIDFAKEKDFNIVVSNDIHNYREEKEENITWGEIFDKNNFTNLIYDKNSKHNCKVVESIVYDGTLCFVYDLILNMLNALNHSFDKAVIFDIITIDEFNIETDKKFPMMRTTVEIKFYIDNLNNN